MPHFIKVNESSYSQKFMETGIFIDYSIPGWAEEEQQKKSKIDFRRDGWEIEKIIKYQPNHIGELVSKIFYGLAQEIKLPTATIYIRPTLKEVLDVYNGVMSEPGVYDVLQVKSRFKNIHEMAEEYSSIVDENKKLREDYKRDEPVIYEELKDESKRAGERKPASQLLNKVFQACKEKYNPLFIKQYDRMRAYSDEARKFFWEDENLKCPAGFDFFKWADLRKNWVNWDQSFYFSDFSPFEKKIRRAPFDISSDDEDTIMGALENGEGDPFGF
jgi:hypothetical protein